MDVLTQFLAENNHIHYAVPDSPDFDALKTAFVLNEIRTPSMIVRPRSADDVAGLVSVLINNDLSFTIRSGGHDMFGRSQVENAITIDMREICHIHIDEESQTVRIGGGIISADLTRELQKHGLAVPHAVTPSVGYVGWATHGGYGLLSPKFGLGVDQIVGATVVDFQGLIREADEDMLTAIRGAGGALGVIVELQIKVYRLDQVHGGLIIFDSSDLPGAIRQWNTNYQQAKDEGIPSALGLYQAIVNLPIGRSLAMFFLWASSDQDEAQKWLSRVCSWASVAHNMVIPTNLAALNEIQSEMTRASIYGSMFAPSFYKLTSEVLDVICEHVSLQPDNPEVVLGFHDLRAEVPKGASNSIFETRYPHYVVEIIPMTSSKEDLPDVMAWGQRFYDALLKTDPTNMPSSNYLPLTPPEKADPKKIYGANYELFHMLKKRFDPSNNFSTAIARD